MLKWLMLLVYILLCTYTILNFFWLTKELQLQHRKQLNIAAVILICLLASTLFLGKFLPDGSIQRQILKFSNYWLGFFIYLLFFMAIADLILLIKTIILKRQNQPSRFTSKKYPRAAAGLVLILAAAFTVYGSIHAKNITIAQHDITIEKGTANLQDLKVVLLADFHLGYSVGYKDMQKMVDKVNSQTPDLVVIAGDIFDNDYDALDDPEKLESILSGIQSRYGVYAVYGNHDVSETLVGGFSVSSSKNALRDSRMDEFLKKSQITLLEDQAVLIDNSFYLIGRLDGEKTGYGSKERKTIPELLENVNQSKPVFFINHEPDHLSDYDENGVDILFSGHTHAGQFFPLTITQPLAWQNYWGIKKIGNLYSVVTSGIGFYGPDLRFATNSEIMVLNIHFGG